MNKYIKAVAIWVLIIPLAILNGIFRENVLSKMGDFSLPLSGIILCLCIFLVALLFVPKIKNCTRNDYIIFGVIWFVLTNLFDLALYIREGGGFGDLLKSYNFLTGNLWVLVVLTSLISPFLSAKIRNRDLQ
ncbi:MAG: hypothetical protein GX271_10510 [Clostridiales bacterium]|nr:hypothetical protein [Clostridiales bacterium]